MDIEKIGQEQQNNLVSNLISLKLALLNKPERLSSGCEAFQYCVKKIPADLKNYLSKKLNSPHWAYEGSVGRGLWSTNPLIAVYDVRVTTRASDGFYVSLILSENLQHIYLTLSNSFTKHINFTPYRLNLTEIKKLDGFEIGKIPRGSLSENLIGRSPYFEASALMWKKYDFTKDALTSLDEDLLKICEYYLNIANEKEQKLPQDKYFKKVPFILR
jgi:hypothetical protein